MSRMFIWAKTNVNYCLVCNYLTSKMPHWRNFPVKCKSTVHLWPIASKKPDQKKEEVWQIFNEWLHLLPFDEKLDIFSKENFCTNKQQESKNLNKGLVLQSRWNDPIRRCFPLYSTIMQQMFSRATFRVTEQAWKRGLLCRVDNNYTSWSLTKMHHIFSTIFVILMNKN